MQNLNRVVTRIQKDFIVVMEELIFEGTEQQLANKLKADKKWGDIDEKNIYCIGEVGVIVQETAEEIFNFWRNQAVYPRFIKDFRLPGEQIIAYDINNVFMDTWELIGKPKFIIVYQRKIKDYKFNREDFINGKNFKHG